MLRHNLLAALLVPLALAPALAQEEIETDRPDQTETATTVPLGTVQIEAGVVYERDNESFVNTFGGDGEIRRTFLATPTVLVRVGIAERFELRVEGAVERFETAISGTLLPDDETETISGLASPSIGMKVELLDENGMVPQMAFIADVTVPAGDSALRSEFAAPAFRFTVAHTLNETFSLGYNLGAEWDGSSPAGAGVYTLTVGAGLGDVLGAYVELFGEVYPDAAPAHMADAGLTFLVAPNVQFDVSAGVGLTEPAADYFIAGGVSLRVPR
jgi:hypothetical protein